MKTMNIFCAGLAALSLAFATGCEGTSESLQSGEEKPAAKSAFDPDYDAALERAKKSGKKMFVLFTGSDWCGWCIKLHNEVLSKEEFLSEAKEEFELVVLDFPNDKSKLTPAQHKRNKELSDKFGVRGFPTIKILNPEDESVIHEAGYASGGPVKWLKKLHDDMKYGTLVEEKLGAVKREFEELNDKIGRKFQELAQGPLSEEGKESALKNYAKQAAGETKALLEKVSAADISSEIESYKKELVDDLSEAVKWLENFAND